uniref:Uncharacterized protein n=1 Tax=Arundo donax TaxID=35708 RepID=A0A0A9PWV0_ARUDO
MLKLGSLLGSNILRRHGNEHVVGSTRAVSCTQCQVSSRLQLIPLKLEQHVHRGQCSTCVTSNNRIASGIQASNNRIASGIQLPSIGVHPLNYFKRVYFFEAEAPSSPHPHPGKGLPWSGNGEQITNATLDLLTAPFSGNKRAFCRYLHHLSI